MSKNGICGDNNDETTELFCNNVISELLLPQHDIDELLCDKKDYPAKTKVQVIK